MATHGLDEDERNMDVLPEYQTMWASFATTRAQSIVVDATNAIVAAI